MFKKLLKTFNTYQILFTVFTTGACALAAEIVGMRVLSPYFGNTMFTTSSVISVFLAALSFGYYLGGVLADRKPSFITFNSIIFLSGMSVLIAQISKYLILPLIGYRMSISMGPIVSSVILFLVPGILLGMISPFAIKLQYLKFPKMGIGKISGEIFFWSTFGSIFGSLATGFILIPRFTIDSIVIWTAILLLLLSVVPLFRPAEKNKKIQLMFLIAVILIYGAFVLSNQHNGPYVYQKEGLYQLIRIADDKTDARPTRYLLLDLQYAGARYLNSEDLVFDYAKYYEIYRYINPHIKNVLVLGGGSYILPQKLVDTNKNIHADVVEIEPGLYDISKEYFGIKESPRMTNHVTDGRRFLVDTKKKYDLMFGDAYLSHFSVPTHMTTVEFFELAKDKLNTNGIFIANIIGSLDQYAPPFLYTEMKTFRQVFPNSYFIATADPSSKEIQNIIFVGVKNDKKIDFNQLSLKESQSKEMRELPSKMIPVSERLLAQYPVFTDNFAPTDYYMHVSLSKKRLAY